MIPRTDTFSSAYRRAYAKAARRFCRHFRPHDSGGDTPPPLAAHDGPQRLLKQAGRLVARYPDGLRAELADGRWAAVHDVSDAVTHHDLAAEHEQVATWLSELDKWAEDAAGGATMPKLRIVSNESDDKQDRLVDAITKPMADGCHEAELTGHVAFVEQGILRLLFRSGVWRLQEDVPLDGDKLSERARPKLTEICRAVNVLKPRNVEDLYGKKLMVRISGGKISGYSSMATDRADEPQWEPEQSPVKPKRTFNLTQLDEIEIRAPQWLVPEFCEMDSLGLIFGDPGCGKSCLALMLTGEVATGGTFRGRPVKQGPVVYIAGEGRGGLSRRLQAQAILKGRSLKGAPILISSGAAALTEPDSVADVMAAIEESARHGPPAMIVLDTLARNYGPGDENSTADMSAFISAVDRLRERWRCAILIVHHSGHSDKGRARGNTALRAAVDFEYKLTKGGDRVRMTCTKSKDSEPLAPMSFRIRGIELPGLLDENGRPVTAAAIADEDDDCAAIAGQSNGKRGKWYATGLEVAHALAAEADDNRITSADWQRAAMAAGVPRASGHRLKKELIDSGAMAAEGEELVIFE